MEPLPPIRSAGGQLFEIILMRKNLVALDIDVLQRGICAANLNRLVAVHLGLNSEIIKRYIITENGYKILMSPCAVGSDIGAGQNDVADTDERDIALLNRQIPTSLIASRFAAVEVVCTGTDVDGCALLRLAYNRLERITVGTRVAGGADKRNVIRRRVALYRFDGEHELRFHTLEVVFDVYRQFDAQLASVNSLKGTNRLPYAEVKAFARKSKFVRQSGIVRRANHRPVLDGNLAVVGYVNRNSGLIARGDVGERERTGFRVNNCLAAVRKGTLFRPVYTHRRKFYFIAECRFHIDVTARNNDVYIAFVREERQGRADNQTCAHNDCKYRRQ